MKDREDRERKLEEGREEGKGKKEKGKVKQEEK